MCTAALEIASASCTTRANVEKTQHECIISHVSVNRHAGVDYFHQAKILILHPKQAGSASR